MKWQELCQKISRWQVLQPRVLQRLLVGSSVQAVSHADRLPAGVQDGSNQVWLDSLLCVVYWCVYFVCVFCVKVFLRSCPVLTRTLLPRGSHSECATFEVKLKVTAGIKQLLRFSILSSNDKDMVDEEQKQGSLHWGHVFLNTDKLLQLIDMEHLPIHPNDHKRNHAIQLAGTRMSLQTRVLNVKYGRPERKDEALHFKDKAVLPKFLKLKSCSTEMRLSCRFGFKRTFGGGVGVKLMQTHTTTGIFPRARLEG